jgi:hypothetical protein
MQFILSLLLLLGSLSSFASVRDEAKTLLQSLEHEDQVSARLDQFSKKFMGLPYGFQGPLGEGPAGRYDQDPLYRFDTFDCTTFVETMVSLALSNDVDEFESNMNRIRYIDSNVDYLSRNHFTDLEWIPENIQNGLLKEINKDIVSSSHIFIAAAQINFGGWLLSHKPENIQVPLATTEEKQDLVNELHLMATRYTPTVASVPYISIAYILSHPDIVNRIPTGSLANFVRPDWDLSQTIGTHQNISHQALLIRKNGILYQRHATSSGGAVQEIVFLDYLKKFENHPTLKGVHFMQVRPLQ